MTQTQISFEAVETSANGIDGRLTVKNRTTEITNELDEEVGLLSGQLVPTSSLATGIDVAGAQTGAHVGLEPLIGADEAILSTIGLLLEEREALLLLLLAGAESTSAGSRTTALALGSRDVTVQSSIFLKTFTTFVVARMVTILHVGSIGDSPLRHCCFSAHTA